MKLLLDANLSHRLVSRLNVAYPGTAHVDTFGLSGETDAAIWDFAMREGYVVVSKDDDFRQFALLRGAPPKVLVVAIGNAGNAAVLSLLMDHRERIEAFGEAEQDSFLVLSIPR